MDRYIHQLTPYLTQIYLSACDFIILHTDILILMLIAFILAIWIVPETRRTHIEQNITQTNASQTDQDNDYNFLATHESIPAQFDLALAYASMGKTEQSMEILRQLALSHHPETRLKATELQETLKSKLDALESLNA